MNWLTNASRQGQHLRGDKIALADLPHFAGVESRWHRCRDALNRRVYHMR
jgi:hypothetical protein